MSNDSDLLIKMAGDVRELKSAVKSAVGVMGDIADSARKIASNATKAFAGMAKAIGASFKAVANFVGFAIKEVINIVKGMSGAVFEADERLRSLMSPERQAATQSLADKWKSVIDALQQMYNIVATALAPVFHVIFDTIILPNLNDMFHLVNGIGNFITSVIVPALQEWGPLIGDIAGHFITAFGDILNGDMEQAIRRISYAVQQVFGEGAGQMVYDFLQGVLGVGGEVAAFDWGGAFKIISDALSGAWGVAVEWFNTVGWPGFMQILGESWAALQTWWTNEGWPGFYKAMVTLWDWFINVGWPFLMATIQTAWNNLQIWWANEGWPGLVQAWEDLKTWWNTTGANDLNTLLTNTWAAIQSTVTWLGNEIGKAILAGLSAAFGLDTANSILSTLQQIYNLTPAGMGANLGLQLNAATNRAGHGYAGGRTVVGEAGPEEVTLPRGSYVGPVTNNFNLTMNVSEGMARDLQHSFAFMRAAVG